VNEQLDEVILCVLISDSNVLRSCWNVIFVSYRDVRLSREGARLMPSSHAG
jgi:hypothetical protein